MNLEEYEKELRNFDWFYELSDDPIVHIEGMTKFEELVKETKEDKDKLELFNKYYKENYSKL